MSLVKNNLLDKSNSFKIGLYLLAEIAVFLLYFHHDARFHWFTHFFIGSSAALLIMSYIIWKKGVFLNPLTWMFRGQLIALIPDILFVFFNQAHQPWMNVFLFHINAHFIPGRNFTWYLVFVVVLGVYLFFLNKFLIITNQKRGLE